MFFISINHFIRLNHIKTKLRPKRSPFSTLIEWISIEILFK